jgi:hypothetical protein
MQQTNFLLASSAIIPLLALALLIELRGFDMPKPPSQASRSQTIFVRWSGILCFVVIAGMSCYGEWVCLRSLELDRVVGFGTTAVWGAIVILAVLILLVLLQRVAG